MNVIDINFLNKNIVYSLEESKKIFSVTKEFVEKLSKKNQSSSYYSANRKATNALSNIRLGKLGEWIVYKFLKDGGYILEEPDTSILSGRHKSWYANLFLPEHALNVHVKSCDENTVRIVGEQSWTFQIANTSGKGGKDILFSGKCEEDLIALVYVDSDAKILRGTIVVTSPWKFLKTRLVNPLLPKYVGLKKCLNHNSLFR